jgi:hypothetical protein
MGTDTTSTASPAHGGTFTAIDSITKDSNGHVTKVNTKTVTLPTDNNTDTKVTQTVTTSNANYPLLLAPSGQTATSTTTSYFDSGVTLNPSTNLIGANISGYAGKLGTLNYISTKSTSTGYLHLFTLEISSAYGGVAGQYAITDAENTFFGIFAFKCRNGKSATTTGINLVYWLASNVASPPTLTVTREIGTASITYRLYLSLSGTYKTYAISKLNEISSTPTVKNTIVTELEGTSVSTANKVVSGKLGTSTVGGTTAPIYLNSGEATSCTGRTVPGIKSLTSVSTLGWGTNNDYIPDLSMIAYWNGAYSETSSNLAYCNKGAFGNAATKSYTDSSSASAIGTGTSVPTERDVYYGLPTINGVHNYTSSTKIYAPTSVGTSGYILTSSGSGAPTWEDAGVKTPVKVTFTVANWKKNSSTGYYEQSVACTGLLTTDDTRTRVEPVGNSSDADAQSLTDEAYGMVDYVACSTAGYLYARCPDGAPTVAFSVYVIISR